MERKQDKNICQKKVSPNQNEDALGKLDNWSQNNLISRSQITNLSESSFANPFDKIEAVFEEIPLVNIRTENITIKVPMISSEDITAYTSMSRNRITQQEKVLQEWFDLFKSMIGWCGGRTDIKNWKDFKDAVKELKDNMKNEMKDGLKNLEDQVKKIDDEIKGATNPEEKARLKEKKKTVENNKDEINSNIKSINKQIKYIKELNNKYDLSDL
jgi:membrane-associated HD superfamily phosphohydrolase